MGAPCAPAISTRRSTPSRGSIALIRWRAWVGLAASMHCARGAASTTQECRTAEWKTGQTMPFSANFDTQLWFDGTFLQKSVRLDVERLEALCARWLGHPLEERLRFELRPFSIELEQIWQRTLAYGWSSEE